MNEKPLTFKDVPMDYALCFNHDCELRDKCLHYHVGQMAPADKTSGAAVYPSAWKDGRCRCFATKEKVEMAWGFDGLYKNLPREKRSEARIALRHYLSAGASTYYRFHHGERLLSPARQKEILDFMSHFCSTEGLRFDHYVTRYDFT